MLRIGLLHLVAHELNVGGRVGLAQVQHVGQRGEIVLAVAGDLHRAGLRVGLDGEQRHAIGRRGFERREELRPGQAEAIDGIAGRCQLVVGNVWNGFTRMMRPRNDRFVRFHGRRELGIAERQVAGDAERNGEQHAAGPA